MNGGPSPLALLLAFPRLLILVSEWQRRIGGISRIGGESLFVVGLSAGSPLPLFFFLFFFFFHLMSSNLK